MDYRARYAPISPINNELLSRRQREIFNLVVVGQSNKEIARTLGLSECTIKIHISKLFEKLGVRNRGAVALAGAKLGLSLVQYHDKAVDSASGIRYRVRVSL